MIDPRVRQGIAKIGLIARQQTPIEYPARRLPNESSTDLAALFERRLNELRGPGDQEPAMRRLPNEAAVIETLRELSRGTAATDILWYGDTPPDRPRDLAIGITPAAALIATTGSVILDLPVPGQAWSSLLVDQHYVVADGGQILPDIAAFYQRLSERVAKGESLPVQVCITGCSRTADIEKLLVIPAHGPRQVRVLFSETPINFSELRKQWTGSL